ncbi:MAG TPA: type II secretion system F family protein [Bdellovibrionales bacterium]|nr:type II secretion system F family protein [Bdellovibrionales bacterium]
MEGLAPPLKCLVDVQAAIANGETARSGLQKYLSGSAADPDFASALRGFLFSFEQGKDWRTAVAKIKSPYRRALIETIACGMSGQSVSSHLQTLRQEIESAAESEIRHHIEMLPLKMLAPLLVFQFPAFLLLLFGPLLRHLITELNQ